MTNFYKRRLQLPLDDFLKDTSTTLVLQVHSEKQSTKFLSINLESIQDIRNMLNKIEEVLVEERL